MINRSQLALQKLQPKILFFTFCASLIPVIFVLCLASRFVNQPLAELEKTRLDDQVLAFRGYMAATEKGLENLTASNSNWTDFFQAVQRDDRTWIKKEVSQSTILATDIKDIKIINSDNEVLDKSGIVLDILPVQACIKRLQAENKLTYELIDTGEQGLILLGVAPIRQSDGKGKSQGTLVFGQLINRAWLDKFLNYSQPTTKVQIWSLQGKLLAANSTHFSLDQWEQTHLMSLVVPTIRASKSVYRIENNALNLIYAPITSGKQIIAIAKIQIVSKYFRQASVALKHLIWLGLILAVLLSVVMATLLAKQIGQPINQLAKRSQSLAAGDLTTPIPGVNCGGEIGQLANAYQEMAEALKTLINNLEHRVGERTQELEIARQTLEKRVEERTEELNHKNQELEGAYTLLQQLNKEVTTKANELSAALTNLRVTQSQLIQTEKMSSLGNVIAGIAHEINNPINFIHGNTTYVNQYVQELLTLLQYYQQRYADPELQLYAQEIDLEFIQADLVKILLSMKAGTERIRQVVLSLRNFSRHDESEMKTVDIHEGLNSTLLLLQHRLKFNNINIDIIKEYSNLPQIECYPQQLNQVFMHVINNAIDALENTQGRVNQKIAIITQCQKSEQIQIKFIDNGCGISEEILPKVFDPFFTTKDVGKGTGLGLAVAYQILQKHHGSIKIISTLGAGCEVMIELPQSLN
jgi:signal transduction histidine kinase